MMRLFLSLHENWQYLNKHCLHRCSCVPSVFSCFELKAMHVLWTLTQIQDFIFLMQWNKMVSKGFYIWKLSQNSFILVSSVQAKNTVKLLSSTLKLQTLTKTCHFQASQTKTCSCQDLQIKQVRDTAHQHVFTYYRLQNVPVLRCMLKYVHLFFSDCCLLKFSFSQGQCKYASVFIQQTVACKEEVILHCFLSSTSHIYVFTKLSITN